MPGYSAEDIAAMPSRTNRARLAALSDEELTANALSDPDNPPLDDDFFKNARRVRRTDLLPASPEATP